MSLEKTVAVVLAGGVKKFSLKEFWHQLEDLVTYREWYFRRGYKSLRKIRGGRRGGTPRPMVEYILNTLRRTREIGRIVVVGSAWIVASGVGVPTVGKTMTMVAVGGKGVGVRVGVLVTSGVGVSAGRVLATSTRSGLLSI